MLRTWQDHPDPDGFHLAIVARAAEMYLDTSYLDGFPYPEPVPRSPLGEQFVTKGLGEPDFALFWDFPW